MRVVEDVVGPARLRVDLHGVSSFGPGDRRTLIRWEWIAGIDHDTAGVEVRSATARVDLPAGAFGRAPEELAVLLERGRSITERPDVIAALGAGRRR